MKANVAFRLGLGRRLRAGLLGGCALVCLGASAVLGQEKLVTEGEEIKYFKGTEAPPADWADPAFDDASWLDGQTPIGYGTDLAFKTTVPDAMGDAGYFTVYTRRKFNLTDASSVKGLKLGLKYDDGVVAYLNGVEIVRKNMNDGPVAFDTPGLDHETNAAFEATFLTCDTIGTLNLKNGVNVLAVEIHNVAKTSSDLSLSFELDTLSSVCPSSITCTYREATNQVLVRWVKPTGFAYDDLALYRNDVKIEPGPVKTATSYTDKTPANGKNVYRIVATACGVECSSGEQPTCEVTTGAVAEQFRRGDGDANGSVNLTDAVNVLNYLFRGAAAPPCPDSADFDDDGALKLTDAVYLLTALFRGGPVPPAPGPDACGPDPTADDALGPCVYTCQ